MPLNPIIPLLSSQVEFRFIENVAITKNGPRIQQLQVFVRQFIPKMLAGYYSPRGKALSQETSGLETVQPSHWHIGKLPTGMMHCQIWTNQQVASNQIG